jgi:HSP20 family protein
MTTVRFNRLPTLWRDLDEMIRDFGTPFGDAGTTERALTPSADIVETPRAVEIRLDLPGVDAEKLDVKVDGNLLTVTAERNLEKAAEGSTWVRQERPYGRFTRSFTLPSNLDGTKPEATYRHGVLLLTLPKKEEALPKSLKVKIEA